MITLQRQATISTSTFSLLQEVEKCIVDRSKETLKCAFHSATGQFEICIIIDRSMENYKVILHIEDEVF